jgi:hypothetical protein
LYFHLIIIVYFQWYSMELRFDIFSELSVVCAHAHAGHTQAVYFIAEIAMKSSSVARFKLHHGLTVTHFEIGNKNIPPKRCKPF